MTLTQLEVLIALDECRSFSRAAMRLGTTQSAVSHALRALETQFAVKLALRNAAGVSMTDAGERLLLRAREMTALAATMAHLLLPWLFFLLPWLFFLLPWLLSSIKHLQSKYPDHLHQNIH